MPKDVDTNSISEVIKASQSETDDMARAPKWGDFKVEVGNIPEPVKRGGGASKYPWEDFPAPANPEDSGTWTHVFIPGVKSPKTLYTSISKYRAKLQEQGVKDLPEFSCVVVKKDGEVQGVRVIRKR